MFTNHSHIQSTSHWALQHFLKSCCMSTLLVTILLLLVFVCMQMKTRTHTYLHIVHLLLSRCCCFLPQAGVSCRQTSAHEDATPPPFSPTPSVSQSIDQPQFAHVPASTPAPTPTATSEPSHGPVVSTDPSTWDSLKLLQRPKPEGGSEQQGAGPSSAAPQQLGSTHHLSPASKPLWANRYFVASQGDTGFVV